MNPFKFPFAMFAFLGFVMVVPAWMWFLQSYPTQLSTEGEFLAAMMLPALVALWIVSWLQPRSG